MIIEIVFAYDSMFLVMMVHWGWGVVDWGLGVVDWGMVDWGSSNNFSNWGNVVGNWLTVDDSVETIVFISGVFDGALEAISIDQAV